MRERRRRAIDDRWTDDEPIADGLTLDASAAPEVKPVDRVMGLYAVLSGVALVFPGRPEHWPLLAILHLLLACLLLPAEWIVRVVQPIGERLPRPLASFVRDWHPLLLLPFFYGEASTLNLAVHQGHYFDPLILDWEQAVFGTQPSLSLAAVLPSVLISEALHTAYFSYYALLYLPPLVLWFTAWRRGEAQTTFHAALLPLALSFALCELTYVWFPVEGPRYHFDPVEIEMGPMALVVRTILEGGSSRGTAFPSSHAAFAVVQTVVVGRYLPRFMPLALVLTLGLIVGAVYGGYHYAIDMAAGVLVGLFAVLVADRIEQPAPQSERHVAA